MLQHSGGVETKQNFGFINMIAQTNTKPQDRILYTHKQIIAHVREIPVNKDIGFSKPIKATFLTILETYDGHKGYTQEKVAKIAEQRGLQRSAIQKHTKKLHELGLLIKQADKDQYGDIANRYIPNKVKILEWWKAKTLSERDMRDKKQAALVIERRNERLNPKKNTPPTNTPLSINKAQLKRSNSEPRFSPQEPKCYPSREAVFNDKQALEWVDPVFGLLFHRKADASDFKKAIGYVKGNSLLALIKDAVSKGAKYTDDLIKQAKDYCISLRKKKTKHVGANHIPPIYVTEPTKGYDFPLVIKNTNGTIRCERYYAVFEDKVNAHIEIIKNDFDYGCISEEHMQRAISQLQEGSTMIKKYKVVTRGITRQELEEHNQEMYDEAIKNDDYGDCTPIELENYLLRDGKLTEDNIKVLLHLTSIADPKTGFYKATYEDISLATGVAKHTVKETICDKCHDIDVGDFHVKFTAADDFEVLKSTDVFECHAFFAKNWEVVEIKPSTVEEILEMRRQGELARRRS